MPTEVPSINLDNGGPDVAAVSDKSGFDVSLWPWTPSSDLLEYEVRVVPLAFSAREDGTVIPTAAGSTNTSGGAVAEGESVVTTIKGGDLKAIAPDGLVTVRFYGLNEVGWSDAT